MKKNEANKPQTKQYALSEESIAAQIEKVLAGDRTAFAPIVTNFQDQIYAVVLAQVGDPTLAKDLAQDTFIRAFKYLKTFKRASSFKTWLTRIAINNVKSYYSSKSYKQLSKSESFDTTNHETLLNQLSSVEENSFSENLILKMRFEVSELNEKNKEIVVLKFFEGLSYQEISNLLKIPIGTVSSRMNSALLALRTKLREV